jgi:hypothetical protein
MDVLKYRGRVVTDADVTFIRELIVANPRASRRRLSKILCEAWNWVQANGVLRDMVCRSLMLELHRAGHIELPPVRQISRNPLAQRQRPPTCELLRWDPLEGPLDAIQPLTILQVRRSGDESLFDSLIETYHYLHYTQPVGEHLKYLISAGGVPVACMAWSSAPRHIGCRDRFIGWSAEMRRRNIRLIAYNTRFLVLPWVRVRMLASHILGWMARHLSADWQRLYHHPLHFVETFVDPQRFRGTCYRAANWIYLGRTTGRGKNDQTNRPNRPIKEVLGYPLSRRFRELLGAAQCTQYSS